MSLRNTLLGLINLHLLHNFKICEIREIARKNISAKSEKHYSTKIYKGIWLLKREGLLAIVNHPSDPKKNTYSLTELGKSVIATTLKETVSYTPASQADNASKLEPLKNRLSEYSSALAAASAEAQEYQELARELPELFTSLEAKFLVAKERAVMFQGRLAAIENVLKDLS
jgi:DNA-binding PadR family transcriptional regulator